MIKKILESKDKNLKPATLGFTLIELLAVIVILAIIALIATPIVLNIIEDSKKSAFKQTGNGIVDAAEYYYMKEMSHGAKPTENKVFTFNGSTSGLEGLEFDGEIPKKGSVIINTEGKVAIGIANDRYCITKQFQDTDVTVTEDIDNCLNPEIPTLSKLATTGTFSKVDGTDVTEITEVHECAFEKTEGACVSGTEFVIQVNETEKYRFYVLKDYGNKVTLILDRNLGDNVVWYASAKNNSYGPITALTALQERTSTWTNLTEMIIDTFEDTEGVEKTLEQSFTMYARLPKYSDFTNRLLIQIGLKKNWLYINLINTGDSTQDSNGRNRYGYWTSTAYYDNSTNPHHVNQNGNLNAYVSVSNSNVGVRPVIELYK